MVWKGGEGYKKIFDGRGLIFTRGLKERSGFKIERGVATLKETKQLDISNGMPKKQLDAAELICFLVLLLPCSFLL